MALFAAELSDMHEMEYNMFVTLCIVIKSTPQQANTVASTHRQLVLRNLCTWHGLAGVDNLALMQIVHAT